MVLGPDEHTKKLCAKVDKTLGSFIEEIEADFIFLLNNALKEVGDNQVVVNQMFSLFFYGVHNATTANSKLMSAMQKEYAPELSELKKNSNSEFLH